MKICLILSGGIAAYKSLELIRRGKERQFSFTCILTDAAHAFVTPLSLSALSGNKTYNELFSLTDEAEMGHIRLSRENDLVVVAPATADLLAKMATGQANDLASTILLATDKPVLVAPAMNPEMWAHKATRRNIERLRQDGVTFVGPNEGDMACGEVGAGRMAEPEQILAAIEDMLAPRLKPLTGLRALVTSGPTHEAIDPVRYIANHSSGRQGHAIAQALCDAGALVTLVTGPVALEDPIGVTCKHVVSAVEMQAAVDEALPADIAIFAAAVADWRPAELGSQKIKKTAKTPPSLTMVENPDILKGVATRTEDRPSIVIGFAAETENHLEHAKAKLSKKRCDWILMNDVGSGSGVFGGARNQVMFLSADGQVERWPEMDKFALANRLVEKIASHLSDQAPAASLVK